MSQKKGIQELFRAAHSLKGAARTVQLSEIEQIAHSMESVFDSIRSGQLAMNSDIADIFYDSLDYIQLQLDNTPVPEEMSLDVLVGRLNQLILSEPMQPEIATVESVPTIKNTEAEPEPPMNIATDDVIRVPVQRLDQLMEEVSNLRVSRMNIEERSNDLMLLRQEYQQWQQLWRRFNVHYIRLLRDRAQLDASETESWLPMVDFLQATQRFMRKSGKRIIDAESNLNNDSMMFGLALDALQSYVRNIRLLPFDTIISGLQRNVRDIARELGKEVRIQTSGTRLELDKQILESLKSPLIHILRNAVDHGIELPSERQAQGKPKEGLILMGLVQRGNKIHIIISDDGRGVDLARVLEKSHWIWLSI